jgi:hypothetical protein
MKATEEDTELYVRGLVMARGGYTFDDINGMSPEEVAFVYHYQEVQEQKTHKFIADMLGTIWKAEDLVTPTKTTSGGKRDTLLIPLSVAINPKILEYVHQELKKPGGEVPGHIVGYTKQPGEQIVSMASLGKDDFLKKVTGKKTQTSKRPPPERATDR